MLSRAIHLAKSLCANASMGALKKNGVPLSTICICDATQIAERMKQRTYVIPENLGPEKKPEMALQMRKAVIETARTTSAVSKSLEITVLPHRASTLP